MIAGVAAAMLFLSALNRPAPAQAPLTLEEAGALFNGVLEQRFSHDAPAAAPKAAGILDDPAATSAQKAAALDELREHGAFSIEAAQALLRFLDREPEPTLREKAAKVLYLLFYDSTQGREAVLGFLLRPDVSAAVEKLLISDRDSKVRRELAELGQIMVFGFNAERAERLAQTYVPLLIRGLGDPDPVQRGELLVALGNFKDLAPRFFQGEATRQLLRERLERETDPDLRERLAELAP